MPQWHFAQHLPMQRGTLQRGTLQRGGKAIYQNLVSETISNNQLTVGSMIRT